MFFVFGDLNGIVCNQFVLIHEKTEILATKFQLTVFRQHEVHSFFKGSL